MKVPFMDLKKQYEVIGNDVKDAFENILSDQKFILGQYVGDFEDAFAAFCGASHCIGVGNGTDALFIALKSIGVARGDEVLVPANSFIATSEAVSLCNARPIFVDVNEDDSLMNLDHAAELTTDKTKAIVPVHLYGQPLDMEAVRGFAESHGLSIVQDCAQAHGAKFKGHPLADYGDICCYSFYPGKNLGAYGDAGAIVTSDAKLAKACRMFANHGRAEKYSHLFEGTNSRMDSLQGAVLGIKLGHLDEWTRRRRANAALYDELLQGVDGVTPVRVGEGRRHVYHLYVVRHPDRDSLRDHLQQNGVATGVHYPIPLPELAAYAHLGDGSQCPVASRLARTILSLPMFPELTSEQIRHVVDGVRSWRP